METKIYIVKDEELLEVYGKEQLIEYATEQAEYIEDYDDDDKELIKESKHMTVDIAIKVLETRGFTVETKIVR